MTLLASLIVGYVIQPTLRSSQQEASLLAFLLSASTGGFITLVITILSRNEQVDQSLDRISSEVNNGFNSLVPQLRAQMLDSSSFVFIGGSSQILRHIEDNISAIEYVYNTRISTAIADRDTSSDVTHRAEIINLIKKCTDRGIRWSEIVSSRGLQRTKDTEAEITNHSCYTPYCLKTDFPVSNFMCLYYKDRNKSEVIFGVWFHENADEAEAFLSSNRLLVDNYHLYYRTIREFYSKSCGEIALHVEGPASPAGPN